MTQVDDFSSLKRNSKASLSTYNNEAKKLNTTYQADERFWSLSVDKSGNGRAIIRFLPPTKGEPSPFAKYFSHGFQVGSSWYIENCPTTLDNKPCPVCEHNSELWAASGSDDNSPLKAKVRLQKRKLHYVSNIVVVSDDAKPENNGKVFLFKYGKKIFEKIHLAMNPQYKDEQAVNPFDFWDGANFIMKQRLVEKYPNFDLSSFDRVSPLSADDDEIKKVWMQQHPLVPFTSKENFKEYDVLSTRFNKLLGIGKAATKAAETAVDNSVPFDVDEAPKKNTTTTTTNINKAVAKATNPEDFFKELMNDD